MKEQFPLAWWLEVFTLKPNCIYYFGPFDTSTEAEINQSGYIEDLKDEGAEGIISASVEVSKGPK